MNNCLLNITITNTREADCIDIKISVLKISLNKILIARNKFTVEGTFWSSFCKKDLH